ncbi:hypothetical protein TNCT_628271 [Trichonephila clavata]|uniref:Uncharacterized protein n=1 Tax=Trichonephila clavata TaxID=2740835 RepID=A0A8X6IZ58_TRICU|nr:hypothetical protein TNCT_628271 [Trichonephila clavata]
MPPILGCFQGCVLKKKEGCLCVYAFEKDSFDKSIVAKALEDLFYNIPEEKWLSTVVIPKDENGFGLMSQAFCLYILRSRFGPIYYLNPYEGKITTEMIGQQKVVVLNHTETQPFSFAKK